MARFIVPDEYMIPVGRTATRETRKCADNWTDSDLAYYRSMLPPEFHSVPLDALKIRWINIRKKGTEGYRTDGHGPTKGWKARKEAAVAREARQGKLFD
jgi:hypothetical protein